MAEENPVTEVLSGVNVGGIFDTGTTIIYWLFIALIVGAFVYFIWYILSFKETIIIKEPVGNKFIYKTGKKNNYVEVKKDAKTKELQEQVKVQETTQEEVEILPYIGTVRKGKIISKKGIKYLTFFATNLKLKVPDQVFQALTRKGKKFIELTKVSEHIYAPTVLTKAETGEHQYMLDESYFSWVINDIEADHRRYSAPSFWSQYGNWIMTAGMMIIIMIIIVITLRYSEKVVQATKPVADAFVRAAEIMSSQKI